MNKEFYRKNIINMNNDMNIKQEPRNRHENLCWT